MKYLIACLSLVCASRIRREQEGAEGAANTCQDQTENCASWKAMGQCKLAAIKKSCPLSCDDCENAVPIPPSNSSSSLSNCEDIIDGCADFASQCDKLNIRKGCRKTCNLCEAEESMSQASSMGEVLAEQVCKDLLPACDVLTMSASHSCDKSSMRKSCAKTCNSCGEVLSKIVEKIDKLNDKEEVVATTSDPTSAENTETAEKEETSDSSESSESSDSSEAVEEAVDSEIEETSESGDGDSVEIPEATASSEKEEESNSNITVVTTAAVEVEEESKEADAGASAAHTSMCLSVLVLVITLLIH